MAGKNLGNDKTSIVAEGTDLVIERVFDAPRDLVWQAMTSPDYISRWWGRLGTTTKVVEMDLRPGGRWRWLAQMHEGGDAPFTGEHLEVVPQEKIVRTVVFDVPPFNSGPPAVETLTLEDLDGKTRVHSSTRFPAEEILAGTLAEGMVEGTLDEYERLGQLLTELA
jgi:uncharacterized protein YndB with AHSA1/START domain